LITVAEYPNIKLYWHDNDRTILVGQADPGWDWENGQKCMKQLNDTVSTWSKTHPVYVILHFMPHAQQFPKAGSALQNMRHLITEDPDEEALTVIVAQANIIGSLIQLASRMYRLADNQSKFRYVTTFDRALEVIDEHKSHL